MRPSFYNAVKEFGEPLAGLGQDGRGNGIGAELPRSRAALVELDGVRSRAGTKEACLLVGATNKQQHLPANILRRFDKKLYCPLPGPPARQALVELVIRNS